MTSSVLFIVTIPTEAEEDRLKQEFLARKLDIKSERVENGSNDTTSLAQKQADNITPKTAPQLTKVATAPTLLIPTPTPTVTTTTTATESAGQSNEGGEGQILSDNVETISGTTIDIQSTTGASVTENVPNGAAIQYGTFPKRRKSDKPKPKDVTEGVLKSGEIGGSLKNVDVNSTVSWSSYILRNTQTIHLS